MGRDERNEGYPMPRTRKPKGESADATATAVLDRPEAESEVTAEVATITPAPKPGTKAGRSRKAAEAKVVAEPEAKKGRRRTKVEPEPEPAPVDTKSLARRLKPEELLALPDQEASHDVSLAVTETPGNPFPGVWKESSLTLPRNTSEDTYVALVASLLQMEKSRQWWIGDALNFGERKWGEKYAQFVNSGDLSYVTLRHYAAVAARFPAEKRRDDVPFSHYAEAARLAAKSLPAAERLIDHAAETGQSARQVRDNATHVANEIEHNEQVQAGTARTAADAIRPNGQTAMPLDEPKITFGQHRDVCRTCACPVVNEDSTPRLASYESIRALLERIAPDDLAELEGVTLGDVILGEPEPVIISRDPDEGTEPTGDAYRYGEFGELAPDDETAESETADDEPEHVYDESWMSGTNTTDTE